MWVRIPPLLVFHLPERCFLVSITPNEVLIFGKNKVFEIKCNNCKEVNQINDRMKDITVKCHICNEVIQKGEVKKKPDKKINSEFIKINSKYSFSKNILYSYDSNSGYLQVEGEMINNSNNNYDYSSFDISLYDKNDTFLGRTDLSIMNFCKGQKRSFMGVTYISENIEIDHFEISFSHHAKKGIFG